MRRNWFSLSLDHGRTWSPEQEVGTVDSVVLMVTPSGRLEPREEGVDLSAGAVIEDLAGALPFTLPVTAVRPGESWHISQRGLRHSRGFGQMQFDLQGEATLDSIIGDRAYFSVRASSRDRTDTMEALDSTAARVTWEISTGRPLAVEQLSRTTWVRGGTPGNSAMNVKSGVRMLPSPSGSPSSPTP